jgi:hypothetical protein
VLSGHVQVAVDLLCLKVCASGLHFYERPPSTLPALSHDHTVRDRHLAVTVAQLHLCIRGDAPPWCSQVFEQRVTELGHRPHHRQQRRSGALFLLLLPPDPHDGNQSRQAPNLLVFRHGSDSNDASALRSNRASLLLAPVDAATASWTRVGFEQKPSVLPVHDGGGRGKQQAALP